MSCPALFEFFNGHYGCHCYLPVYIHITGENGRQRIIGSVLRPGNAGPTKGLYSALTIAIRLVRDHLPQVQIIIRADSALGVCDVLKDAESLEDGDWVRPAPSLPPNARGRARSRTLSLPVSRRICLPLVGSINREETLKSMPKC